MRKGEFDLEDLADQLRQMQKIGGMSGILGMMPGIGKMKKQIDAAGLDDRIVKRQLAIISSMTRGERRKPALLNGERRKRIAAGSGTDVSGREQASEDAPADVGHDEEDRQARRARRADGRRRGGPSPAKLERMQAELGSLDPRALENLPKDLREHLPKGLPGLGGGSCRNCRGYPASVAVRRASLDFLGCRGKRNDADAQESNLVVSLSNHERAAGERALSALRQAQGGDRMETQAA